MTTVVDERIARRRRQVRRERRQQRLRRTILVVVALAVAVALLLVERSPLVAISDVRVTGVEQLAPAHVVEVSGVRVGTSLLRVDLSAAARRVEELPLVREAEATRIDPLTVEIRVTERQPAFVATSDGGTVLLDDEGVVLRAGRLPGLASIEVSDGAVPAPGDTAGPASALGNAVAVATGLPGTVTTRVVAWEAVSPDRAVAVLDDDTRVELGRATDLPAKARALAVVLEDLAGRDAATIDVRSASAPVVTF